MMASAHLRKLLCRPYLLCGRAPKIRNLSSVVLNKYSLCTNSIRPATIPQINFITLRNLCDKPKSNPEQKQLTLFQRFKQMYRDYWYVLVPVHLITSAAWLGLFYYLAKSGVDVAGLLDSWNVPDQITNPLKDSSIGYVAITYALYKIATPVRYTITLGGTTVTINYFKKWGYIKPVPQLREMYKEKKESFLGSVRDNSDVYKDRHKVTPQKISGTQTKGFQMKGKSDAKKT